MAAGFHFSIEKCKLEPQMASNKVSLYLSAVILVLQARVKPEKALTIPIKCNVQYYLTL